MRKTIFDLNNKQVKKISGELLKTPYGRRYMLISVVSVTLILVTIVWNMLENPSEPINDMDYGLLFISFCLFSICILKWLDLIKVYYDEKVKNSKEKQ